VQFIYLFIYLLQLHLAVSNDADLKVVELLLKKFPDAADTTGKVFFCRFPQICHTCHQYVTYIYDMYNEYMTW